MPNDTLIKRLREEDWQLLREIRLKGLQSNPGVFGSNYKKESAMTEAEWREWLTSENAAVFGIFSGAKIVGMTGVAIDRNDPTKKQALLWGSWLEPAFRGKGISDAMYKARIEWARAHPTCERIVVSHRASNEASKRANQKHGFVFTHQTPKQWPDGGIEDDIFYELRLKKV